MADREKTGSLDWSTGEALGADAIVAVMGISPLMEGEEGESIASESQGDRINIGLPPVQVKYLKEICGKGKPVIVVLAGGSPLAIPEVQEIADAVLCMWYPGEEGGNAVADILFGDTSPSGRLPVTVPKSLDQLPRFDDYSMTGRTYRYMTEEPLYPFGFGLSYTSFEYSRLTLSPKSLKPGASVRAGCTVANTGKFPAEEVVQVYLSDLEASARVPLCKLIGFQRVLLKPGQKKNLTFAVTSDMMTMVDEQGENRIEPGEFRLSIGGTSPGRRGAELGAAAAVTAEFSVR
jgi:beta-glucosidase